MVFLGSATGTYCASLFSSEASAESGAGPAPSTEGAVRDLEKIVATFGKHFGSMEITWAQSLERLERTLSGGGMQRVPITQDAVFPLDNGDSAPPQNWISVLNERIAKQLVVRGLSPYANPEVAKAVQVAEDALQEVVKEHQARNEEVLRQYKANMLSNLQLSDAYRKTGEIYQEAVGVLLTQFEKSLDSLLE